MPDWIQSWVEKQIPFEGNPEPPTQMTPPRVGSLCDGEDNDQAIIASDMVTFLRFIHQFIPAMVDPEEIGFDSKAEVSNIPSADSEGELDASQLPVEPQGMLRPTSSHDPPPSQSQDVQTLQASRRDAPTESLEQMKLASQALHQKDGANSLDDVVTAESFEEAIYAPYFVIISPTLSNLKSSATQGRSSLGRYNIPYCLSPAQFMPEREPSLSPGPRQSGVEAECQTCQFSTKASPPHSSSGSFDVGSLSSMTSPCVSLQETRPHLSSLNTLGLIRDEPSCKPGNESNSSSAISNRRGSFDVISLSEFGGEEHEDLGDSESIWSPI